MRDQFSTALKEAMKAGDKRRVATVRLITAALKDRDIEARGNGKDAIYSALPRTNVLLKVLPMCRRGARSLIV